MMRRVTTSTPLCALTTTATVSTAGSWTGGAGGWVAKTWSFGTLNYTVSSGKYFALELTVPVTSGGDVMFAYDTTTYRSAVQVG